LGNRGFINKREKKERIKRTIDFFEEGRTGTAGKENARMKTR